MTAGVGDSPSLRIAFVYDCIFPDSVGGIERRNRDLGQALASNGHRVTLAGWVRRDAADEECAVSVVPIGAPSELHDARGRRGIGASLRFAAQCLRFDARPYDVVEAAAVPYLHLLPLAMRCRLAGRPLVVSWYEYWGSYWKTYIGSFHWHAFARFERLMTGVGVQAWASSLLTLTRLEAHRRRSRPRLLPCGAVLPSLSFPRGAGARPFQTSESPPLLYAGRLIPEKRVDLLLRAIALLPHDHRSDRGLLRIVGEGQEKPRLQRLARELKVEDQVEFVGRLESSDGVARALSEARVAVQPSSREGFGLFPLEGMAAGLPVVYCLSDESAVSELVRHRREGLASEATPSALAAALAEILGSADLRDQMGRAGRLRARDYTWPRIAETAERYLLDVTRTRTGRVFP